MPISHYPQNRPRLGRGRQQARSETGSNCSTPEPSAHWAGLARAAALIALRRASLLDTTVQARGPAGSDANELLFAHTEHAVDRQVDFLAVNPAFVPTVGGVVLGERTARADM